MPYFLKLILLCLSLLSHFSSVHCEKMKFITLADDNGLSQISVLGIMQDSNGFLWLSTRNGLNRYNGYEFDVFKHDSRKETTISDNHITALIEGSDGSLWVGTRNGLNRMDRHRGVFERDLKHLKLNGDPFPAAMHIFSLLCDSQGRIWIGAGPGLYIYDKSANTCLQVDVDDLLLHNPVRAIAEDSEGNIFLGTTYAGLVVLDEKNRLLQHYKNSDKDNYSLKGKYITDLFFDSKETLWVGTRYNGINKYISEHNGFLNYHESNSDLSNNEVRCIEEDKHGNLLIGTFNGLNVLDPSHASFTVYDRYNQEPGDLNHFSIYSILADNSGTVWIGTYAGGVNYYCPYSFRFRFHDPSNEETGLLGVIGPMVEYQNALYIATEGGGLIKYDKNSDNYHYFFLEDGAPVPYYENIIKSLFLDGDTLWCGTATGIVYAFNLKTEQFTKKHSLERPGVIYTLFRDDQGLLFIGSVGTPGLLVIHPDGATISDFEDQNNDPINVSHVRVFEELEKDIYLIGTRNNGLYLYDHSNRFITHIEETGKDYITSVFKDRNGSIWIGSFGAGISLLHFEKGFYNGYKFTNRMADIEVCSIEEGSDGVLWISTLRGLVEYDSKKDAYTSYSYKNGIRVNEFSTHASLRTTEGRLYFSGNNGFISFLPDEVKTNPYIPPLFFSELSVNNKVVNANEAGSILDKPISLTSEVTLKHDESNFTVSFIALNYIFSERNQYAYQLEGFDDDWIDAGSRRTAYYTNIPPGKYLFRVKGANNDGVWNEQGIQMWINITPPFWKTWWAYFLYMLVFLTLLGAMIWHFKMKHKFRYDLDKKQLEKQTLEKFHEERIQLFTNFSHEIRTPLTLIYSPLEELLNRVDIENTAKETLRIVYSNAERLLRLVNQLMDFRKKEEGKITLNCKTGNYISFLKEIVLAFSVMAKQRDINLSLTANQNIGNARFDEDLLEKVFFNLLSNAFKNTPNGGAISIKMEMTRLNTITYPDHLSINQSDKEELLVHFSVADTGAGIPSESLSRVFDPFYQVENKDQYISHGTGLGLSLCKSIVELHDGIIWAENNPEGGAVFHILTPFLEIHSAPDSNRPDENPLNQTIVDFAEMPSQPDQPDKPLSQHTILVVEDNPDILDYMHQLLKSYYHVLRAPEGGTALQLIYDKMPDLVLSDVMMPVMSGVELCLKVKEDLAISHIPVILITARTEFAHMNEGFQSGADDYISKPFSSQLLLLKIKNQLATHERMKQLFSKRFSPESLGISSVSSEDLFIQKISHFIESNISNQELNIDLFCREIGMSRANLYRKMKAVTGMSANEFIRNIRLETAAQLLKKSDLTITDISEKVGFNSIAYFSSCFKSVYKVSPKEYK